MTAPVAHGYPDFGRFQAGADKLLADLSISPLNVLTSYGPYFVGDAQFARLQFVAQFNHFACELQFYLDSTPATFMAREAFSLRQGDTYNHAFPVLGPYLMLQVDPSAAGAAFNAKVTTATTLFRPNNGDPLQNLMISAFDGSYPVGLTILDATHIMPGPATFIGHAKSASTFLDLQTQSSTGVVNGLARAINSSGPVTQQLFLPAAHMRVRITNNSAGAAFFDIALMASPGLR